MNSHLCTVFYFGKLLCPGSLHTNFDRLLQETAREGFQIIPGSADSVLGLASSSLDADIRINWSNRSTGRHKPVLFLFSELTSVYIHLPLFELAYVFGNKRIAVHGLVAYKPG